VQGSLPITGSDEEWRRLEDRIHAALVEELEDSSPMPDDLSRRNDVLLRSQRLVRRFAPLLPRGQKERALATTLDRVFGLGPLEPLLRDPEVDEIMVNDPRQVFVERQGRIDLTAVRFRDDDELRHVIDRILAPLNRRLDESSPYVDARLPDGSRVNAVIPPLIVGGPALTIRRFPAASFTMSRLVELGTMSSDTAGMLERFVVERRSLVISGGTGSGKTSTLNALGNRIPSGERLISIEDAAELRLGHPHWLALEARPANSEGRGEVTIRSLVRNALRMRPDRILVGEVRGGEAFDMLQAMNTGHQGSLTTLHANSPEDALIRLESMVLMAGLDMPVAAIRRMIAGAVEVIIQQRRREDGRRVVSEVVGIDPQFRDEPRLRVLFRLAEPRREAEGPYHGDLSSHDAKGVEGSASRVRIFRG
jgi:pilus assembly protein CpaF